MEPPMKLKIFVLLSAATCTLFLIDITFTVNLFDFNIKTVQPLTTKRDSVKPKPLVVNKTTVVAPFHRHWRTNCSALFAGDENVIKETSKMIQEERNKGSLPLPTDKEVQNWTADCSLYRHLRKYPTKPRSDEEAGYPISYSIMTHKDAAQLERLLRAIYQPQNIICIHPDAKSPQDFQKAIKGLANCFENVFIPSKVDAVHWGGFGMITGDLNCMVDLTGDIGVKYKWKYLINLCGQDFPLKTNLEIVRQLKAHKGHNDINGVITPPEFRHRVKNKGPAPFNWKVFKGSRYIAASRPYVEYVLNDPKSKALLKWADGTSIPEEFYWVTLQRAKGTPGGYPLPTLESNIRFARWRSDKVNPPCIGKYVRAVCIFELGYLRHLAVMPYVFANKFYYNFDPVTLQCLEEALNNRTLHPQESDKLIGFPVTTFVWQNYTEIP